MHVDVKGQHWVSSQQLYASFELVSLIDLVLIYYASLAGQWTPEVLWFPPSEPALQTSEFLCGLWRSTLAAAWHEHDWLSYLLSHREVFNVLFWLLLLCCLSACLFWMVVMVRENRSGSRRTQKCGKFHSRPEYTCTVICYGGPGNQRLADEECLDFCFMAVIRNHDQGNL